MANSSSYLEIPVIRGIVLGVTVYRGHAKLSDLARISSADIYDQINNPMGTQRDLSIKHAKDAYEYVKNRDFAFWPEVFLCARTDRVAQFKPLTGNKEFGTLVIDLNVATKSNSIAISRVDGNHRLHLTDGSNIEFAPIHKIVSFCLAYDLTREQEIILFKDINDNQKRMSTSHLDNIEIRLTPEEALKRKSPDLYIAQKLGREPKSPFFGRIHEGGKKHVNMDIPLHTLRTGISYMLSRSSQLQMLTDADAQFALIKNYFTAVKKWQKDAWEKPREYIMLRGSGLWAICFIGSNVIDKVLIEEKYKSDDMLKILKSGKNWDWSNNGEFKGFGGRGGASEISNKVTKQFFGGSKLSSQDFIKKMMDDE